MLSLTQPTRALLDPAEAVPTAVSAQRWLWPLLVLMLAVSFSGAAFAVRWDAETSVVRELTMKGEISRVTEKELGDQITTASRVRLVGGVSKGVFVMPLIALLFAVALKLAGWLINRPIVFAKSFTTVTVAMLPIALYHLLFGAVALASTQVSDAQRDTLLPSHLGQVFTKLSPELARLASAADLFNLWSALLLGLGFSAATGLSRTKSIVFALVLYAAWAGVFLVGLPAMGGGPGGGGGR